MTFYTKKNGKEYGYYKCNKTGCSTNISSKKMHEGYTSMLERYDLPAGYSKIDDDIYQVAIDELQERKDKRRVWYSM